MRTVRKAKRRIESFGDRACRVCEILLRDSYGANGSRFYCGSCIEKGLARKHMNKLIKNRYLSKLNEKH
jgi:hypothetical protein